MVELAFVDQGYTGEEPAERAAEQGIELEVIKLPEAKKGFVLLPGRWVVERGFPGRRASAAWHVISSPCPRPWLVHTFLPSPASCSRMQCSCS